MSMILGGPLLCSSLADILPSTLMVETERENIWHPYRIHGTGIFPDALLIFMANVGKYAIHGLYGGIYFVHIEIEKT